jgi:hypothetical protein
MGGLGTTLHALVVLVAIGLFLGSAVACFEQSVQAEGIIGKLYVNVDLRASGGETPAALILSRLPSCLGGTLCCCCHPQDCRRSRRHLRDGTDHRLSLSCCAVGCVGRSFDTRSQTGRAQASALRLFITDFGVSAGCVKDSFVNNYKCDELLNTETWRTVNVTGVLCEVSYYVVASFPSPCRV